MDPYTHLWAGKWCLNNGKWKIFRRSLARDLLVRWRRKDFGYWFYNFWSDIVGNKLKKGLSIACHLWVSLPNATKILSENNYGFIVLTRVSKKVFLWVPYQFPSVAKYIFQNFYLCSNNSGLHQRVQFFILKLKNRTSNRASRLSIGIAYSGGTKAARVCGNSLPNDQRERNFWRAAAAQQEVFNRTDNAH